MKKLVFFIPIMAVSLLASCGNSSTLIKHTLNATCTNGTVTGNKGEYQENENVALTFTANEGYLLPASIDDITFTGIDKSGVTYTNTTGNLVFKMPAKEVSITVTATMPAPSKYNLIAVCDNGTVTGNKTQYEKNENVELTFTADVGCSLPASIDDIGISGIARSAVTYVSGTGVLTFKMPTNTVSIAVTATEPMPSEYTLSATCTNGTVTGNKEVYQENENVALTFTANEGYLLPTSKDNISFDGIDKSDVTYSSVTGSLTFKMPVGDVTITVTATEKPAPTKYTLTATCINGTVTGNKGQYEAYEFVVLIFTADEGCSLPIWVSDIKIEGIIVSSVAYDMIGKLTFQMPANDASVEVEAKDPIPWYQDKHYINELTENDIGTIKYIKVNGINQRVRLIGVDHDELTDDPGETAHTTWEFIDLLSDSEGYSLATVWDWEIDESSTNQDYLNSNLRKAFNGGGLASLSWYEKGAATKSTTYNNKSIMDMLPQGLKDELKMVKKPVTQNDEIKVTNTKLFPLSYQEMTETSSEKAKVEGSTYAFYKGEGDTDANRVKHQVKWHKQAATSSTLITDGKYSAENYAGYNSNEKEEHGGSYWLRSPYCGDDNKNAWHVGSNGALSEKEIFSNAHAVAPAFCLGEQKWYQDKEYINSLTEDNIGTINHIKVNGINQDVRLIDVDHDELADDSGGTAHTTWEFVNLLSDSEGYSLATIWDWEDGDFTPNQDYLNSNIRKAFDGEGEAELSWYQIGSEARTSTYTGSVLSMFPEGLQDAIKKVKKPVATTESYSVDTYDTKVFPLSYQEMTETSSEKAKVEGSTYAFYKGEGDKDSNRIKYQIKHHDGAVTIPTITTEGKCSADNYAGYNSLTENYGGNYWLRSPVYSEDGEDYATSWCVDESGKLYSDDEPNEDSVPNYINSCYIIAVAPAFCI